MDAARVHVGRMYLVECKAGTIALMLAALCISGTWPAIMPYLEQRGRQLQHTYLDYSISNLLVAVIFALTFGQSVHKLAVIYVDMSNDGGNLSPLSKSKVKAYLDFSGGYAIFTETMQGGEKECGEKKTKKQVYPMRTSARIDPLNQ
ncbi:hypothetical protein R1flu_018904 [Riccia fluitans]|uniref:CASP-like protein n=1 Tax=Riccia fluitans TaxID=41844 RepID=A0ABD1ZH56_9MARC